MKNLIFTQSLRALLALAALLALGSLLSTLWADWRLASLPRREEAGVGDKTYLVEALRVLPEAHLFGSEPLSGKEKLPLSKLPFSLSGIIQATAAKALISVEGGPGHIYQEGESLPGGVILANIRTQDVVLDNNGHLESLPLPRPKLR